MGRLNIQLIVAIAMQTLFLGLSALDTPRTTAMTLVFHFFATVPFAWITLLCYITASLCLPQEDLGIALGSIGTVRFLGGAIGTTALNIITNEQFASRIPSAIARSLAPFGLSQAQIMTISDKLREGASVTAVGGLTPAMTAASSVALKVSWVGAFQVAFLATIPFGVTATVIAYFVADASRLSTGYVAVHLRRNQNEDYDGP